MRRYHPPFNGKRYLLNTNTGEIHDLENENVLCQINEIKPEHIYTTDSFDDAQVYAVLVKNINNPNGCHYCLPSKDNG